jgi:hypothetical protein
MSSEGHPEQNPTLMCAKRTFNVGLYEDTAPKTTFPPPARAERFATRKGDQNLKILPKALLIFFPKSFPQSLWFCQSGFCC